MEISAELTISTKRNFFCAVLACIACTGILFIRKPDAFLNPQFWAEDGTIFFKSALEDGWSSMLDRYSGYFHFYPRLISCLAVELFPIAYQPHIYNFAALLGLLFVVSHLFVPRVNVSFRFVLALLLVLAPTGTEVGVYGSEAILVLTNTQWYLSLSLLLLLISRPPKRWTGWVFDLSTLLFVGFTGPFLVPFAPLFLARALYEKRVYPTAMCNLATTIAVIQALSAVDVTAEQGRYVIEWYHYAQLGAAFVGPALLGPTGRLGEEDVVRSCLFAAVGIVGTTALFEVDPKVWTGIS